MKVLLGIAIVLFTTYCGRFFAKKYRLRKRFFSEFMQFNERFLNEVSYYKRPIMEFAGKYPCRAEFQTLLKDFFDALRQKTTGSTVFLSALDEYDFLKTDEKAFIVDYFSMFGKGDSLSQKEYFCSVKGQLSEWKEASAKDCQRYGDLYIKLGFLLGLTLLILIV